MIRGHGLVHKIEQENRANRHQPDSYGSITGYDMECDEVSSLNLS